MSKKQQKKMELPLVKLQIISIIILLFSLALFNFSNYFAESRKTYVLGAESNYDELVSFWQNFLINNPTYKPGWIRLAELEFERGNTIEATSAFRKAYQVDPNSPELEVIKLKLGL